MASDMITQSSASFPSVVERTRRRSERRQGFSRFLAAIVARGAAGATSASMEEGFVAAVRDLVPMRRARLITHAVDRVEEGSSRLRFPVPLPSHANLVLEVEPEAGAAVDQWDRHLLRDAARVFGLMLVCRRPAAAAHGDLVDAAVPVIGSSPGMRALRQRVERLAATDFTVLIEGESGSGKELVARQVHDLSPRRRGPFVAVNCAALVDTLLEAELFGIEDRVATGVRARRGKFEAADRGTLFLDEVADLSAPAQAKLLRAVQELAVERVGGHDVRRVDIRVVVATNRSLRDLVATGRFRADLFYRLAGVELRVPPLRRRRDDIVELAEHFLARHHDIRRLVLSNSAVEALLSYDWPGNVRELQRVIERAVALAAGDVVMLTDLPMEVTREYTEILQPSISGADSMRAWGSRYARLVLERCNRNKRRACAVLGISYHTLQSYLRYRVPHADALGGASQVAETRGTGQGEDLPPDG